ncbi:MAG: beta-N-acetylglucosaminidase domain-containing protein [Deinococcales bacterium]
MRDDRGFRSGVIEGFYGRPWSEGQRLALFERMRVWGLDTYVYAPKDDVKHRALWREPYDDGELARLTRLVESASERGLRFVYALAPGLDLRFAEARDAAHLRAKIEQVLGLGVRDVALLFDDVPRTLSDDDRARYGTLAAAQADAANRLHGLLTEPGGGALLFCPTDYCAAMARPRPADSPYLRELGERLEPTIEVLWTGPEVVSEAIEVEHVRQVAAVLRRKPLLWDNLHANDYDLRRVYLGPYAGRPSELRAEVSGILANPNTEAAANAVPLATLAAYLKAGPYEPRRAFLEAVAAWARDLEGVGSEGVAGEGISADDLAFVADFHYLPFEHGAAARAFLDDVAYLSVTPPAAWGDTFAAVVAAVRRLADVAGRLERVRDRELAASLSPYLRDVLAEAGRAARVLERRRRGAPWEAPRDGVGNTDGRAFADELRALLPAPSRARPPGSGG